MKRKRRTFGVLLIIAALVIMQLPVSEADAATSASDFQMEGTTLVKYRGTEKDVSVPDTVEIIGENAFEENDTVERVTLPDSVKRVEAYAFWGCDNLNTVVLGTGLREVGDYSFANCKGLEYMTLPSNIRSIGIQAFLDCVNMTDITIPPEVTTIHETAFDGCCKLYIQCEPGSIAHNYALEFYKKQQEMPEYEDVSDYQPQEDLEQEDNAYNSEESESTENNSVKEPEGTVLGTTQVVGNRAVVFIDNTSPSVVVGEEETVQETEKMEDNGTLAKYTIVDGRIVADQAYYKNTTLGQVILPQGIEEIGQFAFSRSTVSEIKIPEGVKSICYGAFYHCDNLATVTLPVTIETVEPKAFTYSLWVEEFEEKGTEDFLISGNVLVAYRGNSTEVIIPEGVSIIAGEVFMNETQIQKVVLPDSLLTIGEGAFEGCTGLSELHVGTNVQRIKDRAFANCALLGISLPESVKEIGIKAFDEGVLAEGSVTASAQSHETSAERLSNERYRDVTDETGPVGVSVVGVSPAAAQLEGANRSYTLTIQETEDESLMRKAYERLYQTAILEDMFIYDMQLTDSSGIPITKLGKQKLTVIMPLPEEFLDENVVVYSLDRNGQLGNYIAERVKLEGVDALTFQTNYVSCIALVGEGTPYSGKEVTEEYTIFQSLGGAPVAVTNDNIGSRYQVYLKWLVGIGFLLAGTIMILSKGRKSR